jgi:hypothetical protein
MTEDDTFERVAIAGATAIQQIIAERNDLRNLTHAQQQELVSLRVVNQELRGRIALVHRQYIVLAKEIIAQLEKFDRVTSDAMLNKDDLATLPKDHSKLIALANRLPSAAD